MSILSAIANFLGIAPDAPEQAAAVPAVDYSRAIARGAAPVKYGSLPAARGGRYYSVPAGTPLLVNSGNTVSRDGSTVLPPVISWGDILGDIFGPIVGVLDGPVAGRPSSEPYNPALRPNDAFDGSRFKDGTYNTPTGLPFPTAPNYDPSRRPNDAFDGRLLKDGTYNTPDGRPLPTGSGGGVGRQPIPSASAQGFILPGVFTSNPTTLPTGVPPGMSLGTF